VLDAFARAPVELARKTGTPTPHIDAVHALVMLLAQTMEQHLARLQLVKRWDV
jgi:2-dehydropantoate 2-reductase